MSVRRYSLALAAVTLAACSADPVSPVADESALRPDATPSFAIAAGQNTVVVTEDDVARQAENTAPTNNWVLYTRAGTPAAAAEFQGGLAAPGAGIGSLRLTTATSSEKVFLFNYDHAGDKLSTIDAISYATYRIAGSAQQVTALNIQIDYNGAAPGGFATLVFEPVYNTAQGAVVSDQWQTWTAGGSGIWWSTQPINGQCSGATAACDKTWAEIVANNPDATILAIGINQGSGNPGLTTAVDALTLGSGSGAVTYDFEPYRVAADVNACKNGGWMTVKDASGASFRNQGDCVSSVASAH